MPDGPSQAHLVVLAVPDADARRPAGREHRIFLPALGFQHVCQHAPPTASGLENCSPVPVAVAWQPVPVRRLTDR